MLGPLCTQIVNLEIDANSLLQLRKFMPTWAKMIPHLRIKTSKNRPYWGDIPICPLYKGGSTPQIPPLLGKRLDYQSLFRK